MTWPFCYLFPVLHVRRVQASRAGEAIVFLLHVVRHSVAHEYVDRNDGEYIPECESIQLHNMPPLETNEIDF